MRVKIHELKLLGLMDLTPICEVEGGRLFSNCFIDGWVKRIQESAQLIARERGAGAASCEARSIWEIKFKEEHMRDLKLYFEAGQLTEVAFCDGISGEVRRSVRGKSGGAYRCAGSFQWTSAVKGLALLAARAVCGVEEPVIKGCSGSLAASLDYAISKQPMWLTEMFGCDQSGISLIRRMILRTNPERKRPGPTVLSFNERFMPVAAISIFADGVQCSREELVVMAAALSHEDVASVQDQIPKAA